MDRPAMGRELCNRLSEYCLLRAVGKGSYGEVTLAKHRREGRQYVIKKLNLKNASSRERKAAEQEAQLLSRLKHPNIVAYRESWEGEDGLLYIVMGFCEGGDLYHKLKEQKGKPLEENQVVEWFVQIAMALQYLHDKRIMHRDLKTQNIFLTRTDIIKVGDLGIARVLENQYDMASTLIGTPYYMSPELFSNKPYNYKSDVWALGCCVYEMATLKHAFNAKDMNSLVFRIIEGKLPAMPKDYSPQLGELIGTMLSKQPEKRPDVKDILRRPYIKRHISLFLQATKMIPAKTRKRISEPKNDCNAANPGPRVRNAPQKQAPATSKKHKEHNKEKSPVKSKPVRVDVPEKSSPERLPSSDKHGMDRTGVSIATMSKVDIDMSSAERRGTRSDHLLLDEKLLLSDISDKNDSRKKTNGIQAKDDRLKGNTNPDSLTGNKVSKPIAVHNMAESEDTMKLLQPISDSQKLCGQEPLDSTEKLLEPFVPVSIPSEIFHKNAGDAEEKVCAALQPNSSVSEPSISRQRRQKIKEQEGQYSDKFDAVSPRPLPSPPLNVKKSAVKKTLSNAEQHAEDVSDSVRTSKSSEVITSQDRPLSARERRRLKQSQEEMFSAPSSRRASSHGACVEEKSCVENQHITVSRSSSDLVIPQKKNVSARRFSDDELSSSTSSTDKSEGDTKEGKCDSSEMHDLVELMTQTLKMEAKDRCETPPSPSATPVTEFKLHRKYRDTLILHGKAAEEPQEFHFNQFPSDAPSEKVRRMIEALRTDVVQGLGVKLLEKVYDIMDEDDEVEKERHLREHMGEKYANYSLKVQQLKFFEEHAKF